MITLFNSTQILRRVVILKRIILKTFLSLTRIGFGTKLKTMYRASLQTIQLQPQIHHRPSQTIFLEPQIHSKASLQTI